MASTHNNELALSPEWSRPYADNCRLGRRKRLSQSDQLPRVPSQGGPDRIRTSAVPVAKTNCCKDWHTCSHAYIQKRRIANLSINTFVYIRVPQPEYFPLVYLFVCRFVYQTVYLSAGPSASLSGCCPRFELLSFALVFRDGPGYLRESSYRASTCPKMGLTNRALGIWPTNRNKQIVYLPTRPTNRLTNRVVVTWQQMVESNLFAAFPAKQCY